MRDAGAALGVQQSLREDPSEVRESPARAIRTSRPAPISRRVVVRVLSVATGVGLFFSLLGPFDVGMVLIAKRSASYMIYGWVGSLLGLGSARLVARWGLWRGFWLAGLATGLVMMPPMCAVVWMGVTFINGHAPPKNDLPQIFWQTTLICVGTSYMAVLVGQRAQAQVAAAAPPKFLERLPVRLRGAEIWAVEAEDHYLRLHTSKGQDLILMRLADAVAELEGVEGAQVHRSWWVARDAIADARRGDGRATLKLKDGAEVPVSRTYARLLRERGWI
jgi:hypothetical protein